MKTTWTPAAEQELARHLSATGAELAASGADCAEVAEDLRLHLEQEAATEQLAVVTESDVRRWLARLGPLTSAGPATAAPPSTQPPPVPPARRPGVFLLLGGVVLPIATLIAELGWGMCASAFFDPLPSIVHLLLVATVPVANGLAWWALRQTDRTPPAWLRWVVGFALGVAAFYSLLFAPLAIPGMLCFWFFGLGLLPLGPIFAAICAAVLVKRLRRAAASADARPFPAALGGFGLAVLAIGLIEAPVWVTRVGLQRAIAEDPAEQRAGLRWLRALGHEETLLRACYGRTRGAANLDVVGLFLNNGGQVSPDQAREVYYRVTGRAFNTVPAPRVRTARGAFAPINDWTWDDDQGGQEVGGRVRGLTLQTSRLDATLEPDAALAYLEWTLEFKNASPGDAEARAQILLPPGGVISRLTLWVNGEEREAAFAGRSQVRQAYEQVAIRQRRDPILVTTAGPDRVLMQCFPVPRYGGPMRVRIGITAPLVLENAGLGLLRWPCFIERNFTLTDSVRHALWLEGQTELVPASAALHAEQPKPGQFAARGQVTDPELCSAATAVRVKRDPAIRQTWTADSRSGSGGFVLQRVVEATEVAPQRLVLVVDGSVCMKPFLAELGAALTNIPPGMEVALIVAADAPAQVTGFHAADAARLAALASRVRSGPAAGGQDNAPALGQALNLAAQQPNSAIVWIHGPQAVALSSVEVLRQASERRSSGPPVYELQVTPGPNRIVEQLDGLRSLRSVSRLDSAGADLARLLRSWREGTHTTRLSREHVAAAPGTAPDTRESSLHLARLWAAEQVQRLAGLRQNEPALKLASAYQVVTPISGAVVLETQQQYAQNNLTPVDADSVPSIPEPRSSALLLMGLIVLALRKRRAAPPR